MKKEPIIRFVEKRDLQELFVLCQLHAIFEKSQYHPKGKAEGLENYLFSENPPLFCLVVEWNHKLVGYASYTKQFSTWDASYYIYMDCLFLTEKSRGFGIGEKIVEIIKQESQKLNCNTVQWRTPEFNTRAMKFYNRLGGISKTKERYFLNI